jgi:hypothetical protein
MHGRRGHASLSGHLDGDVGRLICCNGARRHSRSGTREWPAEQLSEPHLLISTACRHSSAVEQLFRKSPALCAVLPRVETRRKRAHFQLFVLRGSRRGSTLRAARVEADVTTRNHPQMVGRSRVRCRTLPARCWRSRSEPGLVLIPIQVECRHRLRAKTSCELNDGVAGNAGHAQDPLMCYAWIVYPCAPGSPSCWPGSAAVCHFIRLELGVAGPATPAAVASSSQPEGEGARPAIPTRVSRQLANLPRSS